MNDPVSYPHLFIRSRSDAIPISILDNSDGQEHEAHSMELVSARTSYINDLCVLKIGSYVFKVRAVDNGEVRPGSPRSIELRKVAPEIFFDA